MPLTSVVDNDDVPRLRRLWGRLREHFTEEELLELGYFSAYAFGGQRTIKTLDVGHGEVLNLTSLGLAPDVAEAVGPEGARA